MGTGFLNWVLKFDLSSISNLKIVIFLYIIQCRTSISILYFLKSHYAVNRWSSRVVVFLPLSYLNSFFSTTDIEETRPIGRKVKLNITPFEHMDAWKHFRRLPYHYIKLSSFLVHLSWLERVQLRIFLRNEFIPNWTEIVIVGMVNETKIRVI